MAAAKKLDFNQIKKTIRFADVLEHYGELDQYKEKGIRLTGPCPFCEGQTCFKIQTQKNMWFCHNPGCEAPGGTIIDYVMRREGCELKEAAQKMVSWFSAAREPENTGDMSASDKKHTIPKRAAVRPDDYGENTVLDFTLKSLDPEHEYFAGRKFSSETVEAFQSGYFTGKGVMAKKVAIAITNLDGNITGYAGIDLDNADAPYTYADGFRMDFELYNADQTVFSEGFVTHKLLYIVQDYFDAWRLHELGYENVVAYVGNDLSPQQLKHLAGMLSSTHHVQWFLANTDEQECAYGIAGLARLCYVRVTPLQYSVHELNADHINALLSMEAPIAVD